MADAYVHRLLVDIEGDAPAKLKNKLVKYFQSKKASGGDCEVDYSHGSRTAVLSFRTEQDRQNVLRKEAHEIPLERGALRLTVRLPAEETIERTTPDTLKKSSDIGITDNTTLAQKEAEGKDDEAANDDEPHATSAVLENIPDSSTQGFLEMLVENIARDPKSPSSPQNYTLEVIPGKSAAVVTFQSAKETSAFIKRCPANRTFKNKGLSIRLLELTKQVLVKDVQNLGEDLLELYFEAKGGDVERIVLNEPEESAVITFNDYKAVQKILKKKHDIRKQEIRVYPYHESLSAALYGKDRALLVLPDAINESIDDAAWRFSKTSGTAAEKRTTPDTLKKSSDIGKDDEAANDDEPHATSAVLENIPDSSNQEFLEMLVENIARDPKSPSSPQNYTMEVIPGTSAAVVTFQTAKETSAFIKRCPANRTFKNKGLSIRLLELTKQVLVEDVQNLNEDLLELYFEAEGGDVERIVLNEPEESAVITFNDYKAVQKILKKKHDIRKQEIRVYPYHESLSTALYGKDRALLVLPDAINESIDDAVGQFLKTSGTAAETVKTDMGKHFCNVHLQQSTVCLSPMTSLFLERNAKTLIKTWKNTVKAAFAQVLLKFKTLKFELQKDEWQETTEKVRQVLDGKDVAVVFDEERGILSVTGHRDDANRFQKNLSEVVDRSIKTVQRRKSSISVEISLSHSMFHILCHCGVRDKLLDEYPELELSYSEEKAGLIITGLREEILQAKDTFLDGMLAVKRHPLEIDTFLLDLLKTENQKDLTHKLLTSRGVNAAIEVTIQGVQLIAASERDLNDAEELLCKLLKSQCIDVEDGDVLKKREWNLLVSQIEDTNKETCPKLKIQTTGNQVVVLGHTNVVEGISRQLEDFLKKNSHVEEVIVVKPSLKHDYVRRHHAPLFDQMKEKAKVNFRNEAICLSGLRVNVEDCKTIVDNLVSTVVFENVKVTKPGLKNFFCDKESLYIQSIQSQTGCLVQVTDEADDGQNGRAQNLLLQLQTPDGVEIAVSKADMCSYSVHAVVNASNQDLKHSGGLSAALLKAAGPQLQDECDKLIKSHGQLRAGDCVVTGAGGQLACQKLIHAVGPTFDTSNPQKAKSRLKKVIRACLDLAEKEKCVSLALPAISRNQGFPLNVCATTIVIAVKEHCEERFDDSLKKIHLVNNDDATVNAMVAAVKKVFGSLGVSYSQQATQATIAHPAIASDPNCLGHALTKEGLSIMLMKGQIENATTEVIVNTVAQDLQLNKGAVSNAIFSVAGSKLQDLIHAQRTSGSVGELIVTDGCNLRSKKVFHAVAPQWDKGQGTAEQVLTDIFKDCLGKAENSGFTSLTFPAIGTGNLGFPRNIVASLLLSDIVEFSNKRMPQHLKKVMVVLYGGDAQTIQAFSDEFAKIFPSAISSPAASSVPQTSGPFSKVTSRGGLHEAQLGGVTVQVATGDITKETTDVIVNSSNEDFNLRSGVSQAILEAAGQAVEAECQTLASQAHSGIIMTQPGNLKCKKILHLTAQTDLVKLSKVVKAALHMCSKNSYTSVSFPAIGTGQGNVQARLVADAMLDAVIEMVGQSPSTTLKKIRIVIFQAPMLKEFCDSMQQREATQAQQSQGFWGNIGSKIKSLLTGGTATKSQTDGNFIIDPLQCDPTCFHICGDSQVTVDKAKQLIHNLISKEYKSMFISDDTILSFSDADYLSLVDIQKNMGVGIKTESKNFKASITIEGHSQGLVAASMEVHDMLRKTRDEEELKKKVELTHTRVDWQYEKGTQHHSFDAKTNFALEQALEKQQPSVMVKIENQDYTVTLPDGPATDTKGGTLQIKRIDKLKGEDLPSHWDAMPANTSNHSVTILAGTTEHTDVLNRFQATCQKTVTKIERIQNPLLWKTLQIKKQDLDRRNGRTDNERLLFHGTCFTIIHTINKDGFNRSYAGKNAACYGNGTYFAVNAKYSASDTYSRPNAQGEKCMYLCRVLTGEFTLGKQNMIVPPTKGAISHEKYDSVVDNVSAPSMFVIFHDTQAYPEYLITFK